MCDEFFDLFSKLINQSNKDKIENFKIGLPGNWLMFKNRIMNKFRNNYLMSIRKLFKMYKKKYNEFQSISEILESSKNF